VVGKIVAILSSTDRQPLLQRDLQAISEECDEDMRFNPFVRLMIDRTYCQVVLELLERLPISVSCT
jgi:hypothetical protein